MSEPRHLDAGKRVRLRLRTRHSGAHRASRTSTIAEGPEVRVPELTREPDDLDGELEALISADSQGRHPAAARHPRRPG